MDHYFFCNRKIFLVHKGGWSDYLKFGLIYDTGNNEPSPSRSAWIEILAELSSRFLGSSHNFSRITLTDRRYCSIISDYLVCANRVVYEMVIGSVPFYEMFSFGSSFRKEEGLGGSRSAPKSIRW